MRMLDCKFVRTAQDRTHSCRTTHMLSCDRAGGQAAFFCFSRNAAHRFRCAIRCKVVSRSDLLESLVRGFRKLVPARTGVLSTNSNRNASKREQR
jgi:hypothetical protein